LVTPPLLPLPWLPAAAPTEGVRPAAPAAPVVVTAVGEPEVAGPPTPGDVWNEMARQKAKKQPLPAEQAAQAQALQEAGGAAPEEEAAALPPEALPPQPSAGPPAVESPPPPPSRTVSLATLLGCVWIAGSALWFVRAVRRLARFERLLRHA